MKHIFKTAILVMAMMISASFAFGQNTTGNNPSGGDIGYQVDRVWLKITAILPGNIADQVSVKIVWYNENGPVGLEQEVPGQWTGNNNTWEFPDIWAPLGYFPGPNPHAYIKYCAVAKNTISTPKKTYRSGDTFDIILPPNPGTNHLIIASGWSESSLACYSPEPAELPIHTTE